MHHVMQVLYMCLNFAEPSWTYPGLSSSQEHLIDPGPEELQFAAIHQLDSLLRSHDILVGVVEQLLPDGILDSVPPGAQLGSSLKNIHSTPHRLSKKSTVQMAT